MDETAEQPAGADSDVAWEAARDANDAVYQRGTSDADLRGMGTTLVAIAPMDGSDAVATR